MPNNVACNECGFLCITGSTKLGQNVVRGDIPAPDPPVYIEATRSDREFQPLAPQLPNRQLICFAEEQQWKNDLNKEQGKVSTVTAFIRNCDSYFPYVLGHNPKEHAMMKLQERRDEREDWRDDAQREFQSRQEKQASEHHEELLRIAKSGLFWDVLVLGIVVTLVLSAVTIVAALIESGYWTLWWDKSIG